MMENESKDGPFLSPSGAEVIELQEEANVPTKWTPRLAS